MVSIVFVLSDVVAGTRAKGSLDERAEISVVLGVVGYTVSVTTCNWLFDTMARSVFQDIDYATAPGTQLGSVLAHVTPNFPPTYVSDGNIGSFAVQNRDLAKALHELGVPIESNFPGRDVTILFHVWDLDPTTELGAQNFSRTVRFMDQYMR